jgi:hypothetical protein
MGIAEIIGIAASVSLLSGWRLYLCILATGLAMHYGAWPLPEHLSALRVLGDPWVIGVAGIATVAEFLADKVAWFDSLWDTVHTLIRPVGGALLALAVVDPSDPAIQVIAFLLGGGASLLSHGAKAGTRAAVNTSPEPVSNVVVSTGEDLASAGLLYLVFAEPAIAAVIAAVILLAVIAVLVLLRRVLRRILRSRTAAQPPA